MICIPQAARRWYDFNRPPRRSRQTISALSLIHMLLTHSRSWCADSRVNRVQLKGRVSILEEELALLTEEIRIKDARMSRISAHQRPHYSPQEQMAILEIKATRRLNAFIQYLKHTYPLGGKYKRLPDIF